MQLKDKARRLLELHDRRRILVLPNAWDALSARIFEDAGFPAVATTSAGVAACLGYPDGQRIPRDEMLDAVARIARAVAVPVTADLEAGYGLDPAAAAETAALAMQAGAVGMNLEDDLGNGLLPLDVQNARVAAVRERARAMGVPFVVNARTDVYLRDRTLNDANFKATVERLRAYRSAGADSVFAPGVSDRATIARLAAAIDAPLNVLAVPATPPVDDLQQMGVARVSIGSAASRAVAAATRRIAKSLQGGGGFEFLSDAIPYDEINALMATHR